MPVEVIIEAVTEHFIGPAVEAAVDLVASNLFRSWLARYFHGIGRRLIAVATLGKKQIPSSLRIVPKGTQPKPRPSDWLALWVGLMVWTLCAGLTIGALIIW